MNYLASLQPTNVQQCLHCSSVASRHTGRLDKVKTIRDSRNQGIHEQRVRGKTALDCDSNHAVADRHVAHVGADAADNTSKFESEGHALGTERENAHRYHDILRTN